MLYNVCRKIVSTNITSKKRSCRGENKFSYDNLGDARASIMRFSVDYGGIKSKDCLDTLQIKIQGTKRRTCSAGESE